MRSEVSKKHLRLFPKCVEQIYGKRYLLPQTRAGDYTSQDLLNDIYFMALVSCAEAEHMHQSWEKSQTNLCEWLNTFEALRYGRPTLYLERELGEKLIETDIPDCMTTDDVQWPWTQFRIVLPKRLVNAEVRGEKVSLHYIDTFVAEPDHRILIDPELAVELDRGLAELGLSGSCRALNGASERVSAFGSEDSKIWCSCLTDISLSTESWETVTWKVPWIAGYPINNMLPVSTDREPMTGSYPLQHTAELRKRARHLYFNLMLYMSQINYEPKLPKIIRKPVREGKSFKSGLAQPHFVGENETIFRPLEPREPSEPTGRTVAPHWVRGAWRRQPYGPKSSLRKPIWIRPYRTGKKLLEAAGENN